MNVRARERVRHASFALEIAPLFSLYDPPPFFFPEYRFFSTGSAGGATATPHHPFRVILNYHEKGKGKEKGAKPRKKGSNLITILDRGDHGSEGKEWEYAYMASQSQVLPQKHSA